MKKIEEVEFTVFDTETTGLAPQAGDRIVEIAAVRIKGDQVLGTFESLVNPGRDISEAAFAVNHISQKMLEQAPAIEAVMPGFLDFSKDSCLCCYNAGFDMGFLNNELKLMDKDILRQAQVIDILKMSRRLLPGLERYALWFVAQQLGIRQQQEHRALSDVRMTLGVFNRLRDNLSRKGIDDFDNFLSLFGLGINYAGDLNNRKIAEIQEAIDLGVKLKIKYISSSGQVTAREVTPKQVRQENSHYYLSGYCSLRSEERSFRVDGILQLEII